MHAHQIDPYHVLGVKSTASAEDIKKAYRRLAREHHPDIKPGDKRAEERFKDISSAYDLLSDPHKRRQFDDGEIDAHGNMRTGFRGHDKYGYNTYKRGAKKSGKNPFNSFFKDRAGRASGKKHQSIKA